MLLKKYMIIVLLLLNVNLYSFNADNASKELTTIINTMVTKIKNIDKLFTKAKYFFNDLKRQMTSVINGFSSGSSDKLSSIKTFLNDVLGKLKSLM